MRNRPKPGCYKADDVEQEFEKAGRTLIALPWAGCFPAGLTCLWPEVGGGEPARFSPPSSAAITDMGIAYGWIALIGDKETNPDLLLMMRKLVLMRSLVMPDSPIDRPVYVYPWRKLRVVTGLHSDTLMNRWGLGVDWIVRRLNKPGLCAKSGGKIGLSREQVFRAWANTSMAA